MVLIPLEILPLGIMTMSFSIPPEALGALGRGPEACSRASSEWVFLAGTSGRGSSPHKSQEWLPPAAGSGRGRTCQGS